jgi:hypothetical protein
MFLWYVAGVIASILIAWLAATIHVSGNAPVGIISLGIGIALGTTLAGIAASQRLAGRLRLLVGTIILSLILVLAEHAWLYRDFRRQWHEARISSPAAALFRPEVPWSPAEYFARELTPQRAALWSLDVALITVAAIATMSLLARGQVDSASRPTPEPPTSDL